LDYLHKDEKTDVILLYLEELRDGRGLIEEAKKITSGPRAKPILAIKSGRTPQGADAASSHTGSLAGEDAVCDAVFREAGITRVNSIEELFDTALLLTNQPVPAGNRVAIVTNAGGPGVMATDAAVSVGLKIARFAPETTDRLKAALPAAANIRNPVDVIGDARSDRYEAAMTAVLDDPGVDQALVILTPQSMTDIDAIARSVVHVKRDSTKPLACSFMGATDVESGIRILQEANVPHYILPEFACVAMANVQRYCDGRARTPEVFEPLPVDAAAARAVVKASPAGYLREDQALDLLTAYGLPVPPHRLCPSADEAVAFADEAGYPVVLRVVSPQIVHKFELKGVALDLADAGAVASAYKAMVSHIRQARPDAEITGVLVRPMIPPGHEVILGAKRDPAFGPILMFGLGGVFVEVFRDVTFGLAPITASQASRMVRGIRSIELLQGARGTEPGDLAGIEVALRRLGQLVADFDRIAELDVNPLIVGPVGQGCAVADVRIRLV